MSTRNAVLLLLACLMGIGAAVGGGSISSVMGDPFIRTGVTVHPVSATDDFAVGGTDLNAPLFYDESAQTLTLTGIGNTPACVVSKAGTQNGAAIDVTVSSAASGPGLKITKSSSNTTLAALQIVNSTASPDISGKGIMYTPTADPLDCTDDANRGYLWMDVDFHFKGCVGTLVCATSGVWDFVGGTPGTPDCE